MDPNLVSQFLKVTESAAIASFAWVGKGDRHAADDAATQAMRTAFNAIDFDGTVVIGEGERDEAPMLFIGEKLGTGKGPKTDIAVDPLEGTNLCAKGEPNSICVLAAGPDRSLFHAPDTYMDKIAVGAKVGNAVSLSKSVEENLDAISKKTGKKMDEVVIVVLDRPRNQELIQRIQKKGAKVKWIPDGDVFGGLTPAFARSNVDALMGIGAAPEGVLTAAALKTTGGYFEGRLKFRNEEEKERAKKMGVRNLDKIYMMNELVKGENVVFVATGVTSGDLLQGVKKTDDGYATHSLIMQKDNTLFVENKHKM